MLSGASEIKTYTPRELRIKLAEHDLNAKEFAELVGVSKSYIGHMLTGRHQTPSRVVRIRIAEVVEALDAKLAEEEQAEPQARGQAPRVRRL